jgi:hypothetical protein
MRTSYDQLSVLSLRRNWRAKGYSERPYLSARIRSQLGGRVVDVKHILATPRPAAQENLRMLDVLSANRKVG